MILGVEGVSGTRVVKHFWMGYRRNLQLEKSNTENKYLYLTSREKKFGIIKSDGVLLEMYQGGIIFGGRMMPVISPSFQLMNTVGQYEIFIQLFFTLVCSLRKKKITQESKVMEH